MASTATLVVAISAAGPLGRHFDALEADKLARTPASDYIAQGACKGARIEFGQEGKTVRIILPAGCALR